MGNATSTLGNSTTFSYEDLGPEVLSNLLDQMSKPVELNLPSPSPGQVSWQSAFWPIIACMATVMMQNVGRVCGGPLRLGPALRSSPLMCIVDTVMLLLEFAWLVYVGCSMRVAARHVWYDRFDKGSEPQKLLDWDPINFEDPEFGEWDSTNNCRASQRVWRTHDVRQNIRLTVQLPPQNRIAQDAPRNLADPVLSEHSRYISRVANLSIRNGPFATADSSARLIVDTYPSLSSRPRMNHISHLATIHMGVQGLYSATMEDSIIDGFHAGSAIDRTWRLSMIAFLLGSLPQIIKIFGMRGIPITQCLVAVFFVSFILAELLRMGAGAAGEVQLDLMHAIVLAKMDWNAIQVMVVHSSLIIHLWVYWGFSQDILGWEPGAHPSSPLVPLIPVSIALAIPVTLFLRCLWTWIECLTFFKKFIGSMHRQSFYQRLRSLYVMLWRHILHLFDLDKTTRSTTNAISLWVIKSIGIAVVLRWTGWIDVYQHLKIVSVNLQPDAHVSSSPSHFLLRVLRSIRWFLLLISWCYANTVCVLVMVLILHLVYRLLFRGPLSKYPRKVLSVDGSIDSFLSGIFILLNFYVALASYGIGWWDPTGTYKPEWADRLG